MIKLGLIGCGGIAFNHRSAISVLSDRCVLDVVFDEDISRARQFSQGTTSVCATNIEEFLHRDLDAVIIAVPNQYHVHYVNLAAQRGLAILCEKPASDSQAGAYSMMQEVERANVVNMIGFVNRYRKGISGLYHFINRGDLGTVFVYREICSGARLANDAIGMEWRMNDRVAGSGALADFGSHSLDMATWMLEPQCGQLLTIQGTLGTFIKRQNHFPTNDDMSIVTGRFASGALLSLLDSRVGPGTYQIEIMAARGYATFDIRDAENFHVTWYQPREADDPLKVSEEQNVSSDPFVVQLSNFLDAVETHTPIQPDFRTAYKIQRLVEIASTQGI